MSARMELKPVPGSTHSSKRRGRGHGSGLGKTAGRGHKGWHSRSGSKRVAWYEGGQMPLQRRVPKRGFSNYPFRTRVEVVNLDAIARLELKKVDPEVLKERGLIQHVAGPVKVLGNGDLGSAVEIKAHRFSVSAKEKIEKAGGQAILC